MLTPPGNALLALLAAASWGGGDFAGGMGVKAAGDTTAGALRVIQRAHAISLLVLMAILVLTGASWPDGAPARWALVAGITSALSLTVFYLALARGAMGAPAAVSGLLAAAIPAAVSAAMEGAPGPLRLGGFLLAGVAIWVIASAPAGLPSAETPAPKSDARGTLLLATLAGLGFGFYFVALREADSLGVFMPMALSRSVSTSLCTAMLALLWLRRRRAGMSGGGVRLGRAALAWTVGVAVLDTGGNLLFLAASRRGRLDVAAVLSSLYPAATILLAAWQLHERPSRRQLVGMAVALTAVVMITL